MQQQIPQLGFGTYRLKGEIAYDSTLTALKLGYRHIDTANLYKNEYQVGKAIKDGSRREDIWITTKVQVKDINKGKDAIINSIKNSLEQLNTDYLDLVLFHGPTDDKIKENWLLFEEIYQNFRGNIRYIGVSNYNIDHLEQLKDCNILPYTNQIEVSPFLNRDELIKYCQDKGIIVTAHTSLIKGEKFNDIKLRELSDKTGISMANLLLSWAKQKKLIVLPRSGNKDHIKENMECINIQLSDDIINIMNSFHDGTCTHPKYI